MYMRNLWKGKRGTSLVEVLVVMVVLLVGIMTVVQMFPTGFRVVRAGESQSIASKLAQQEIERWKGLAANLPAGIVPIRDDGSLLYGGPAFSTALNQKGAMPGPPLYGHFDFGAGIERANALNRRMVIGETTSIPTANYFQTGGGAVYGSRYMLAFSPIDVTRDSADRLVGLAIKGGDMRRRDVDPSYLKTGEFAARYFMEGNALRFQVAVAPNRDVAERLYYVSFSYWAKTGQNDPGTLYTELDVKVPVVHKALDNRDRAVWIDVPFTPEQVTADSIEMDSIACARGFREQPDPWTLDPYEFKLADPILGVIAFNPNGYGIYERTSLGLKPLEARIDYRIYDLRIIREDRVVPAPATRDDETIPIKMSLRFILNIGDPTDNPNEPDGYQGLIDTQGLSLPVPIYIVDLSTGLQVQTPADFFVNNVDFKTGIVDVPHYAHLVDWEGVVISSNVDMVGRHLRFFYRADGDWSVQCHKAYSNYTRVYDDPSLIDYRSYMLVTPRRLLFAPCDLDQTVSVDFTYGKIGGGSDGERRVVGYCAQIQMDINGDICVDLPLPEGAEIRRLAVIGVSLRARVVWRDGTLWRHVDIDTNLTRE